MDRKKIQDQMRNGFSELAPDIFDQIKNAPLPDCLVLEEETKTTKKYSWQKMSAFAAAAVACFLLFLLVSIQGKPTAIVYLDVNPSIQLELNKDYNIKTIKGLNKDGKIIVDELNLPQNISIHGAINHIMSQLFTDHYLSSDSGILVSIQSSKIEDYNNLKDIFSKDIQKNLEEKQANGIIIAFQNTPPKSDDTGRDFLKKKLVKQYNLSDIQADSMSIGELIRYSVNHNSADIEIFEPKPETSPAETEMQPEKLVMEDQPNTDSSVTPSKEPEIEKNNSDKSSDKEYDSESKTDLSSDNKQKSKDNNAKNNSSSQNNGKTPDKNTSDKSVKDKTKPAKTKKPTGKFKRKNAKVPKSGSRHKEKSSSAETDAGKKTSDSNKQNNNNKKKNAYNNNNNIDKENIENNSGSNRNENGQGSAENNSDNNNIDNGTDNNYEKGKPENKLQKNR